MNGSVSSQAISTVVRARSARVVVAVLGAVLLAACASPPRTDPGAFEQQSNGRRVAQLAEEMLGAAYRYGGSDPERGFDCSGLVHYSHRMAGISVPRTSRAQFRQARKIELSRARAGDVVFFSDRRSLSHVGIYLGAGRFVHAPQTGKTVAVGSLSDGYYRRHLVGVGRLH